MATRRRDIAPRKDKTEHAAIATSNAPPRITNSTVIHDPKKHITAVRSSATDIHKQLVKKKASTDSTHKPTHTKRTLEKNPLPPRKTRIPSNPSQETTPLSTRKTRVSTASSLTSRVKTPLSTQKTQDLTNTSLQFRPSLRPRDKTSLQVRKTEAAPRQVPGKTIASQKPVPGKTSKSINKENGRRSLPETPKSTTLKMGSASFEQETDIIAASTRKEQTNCTFQGNNENLNIYQNLPEVETLLEDQELDTFFLQQEENVEHGEHIIEVEGDGEKGITDLAVVADQGKPLDIVETEDEIHDDDGAKILTMIEPSTTPLDVKTQESEEKLLVEKNLEEEHSEQEIVDSTYDINKSVSNDYHKEEDEAKKFEVVVEVIVKVFDKKDEVSGETKEPEVVEKHNHESENEAPKKGGPTWKKDSVVSNNAIKEAASKLRDQRISRVRALAGAFESVMQ